MGWKTATGTFAWSVLGTQFIRKEFFWAGWIAFIPLTYVFFNREVLGQHEEQYYGWLQLAWIILFFFLLPTFGFVIEAILSNKVVRFILWSACVLCWGFAALAFMDGNAMSSGFPMYGGFLILSLLPLSLLYYRISVPIICIPIIIFGLLMMWAFRKEESRDNRAGGD